MLRNRGGSTLQRLPEAWLDSLDLPLIAAPMFLVSSIELVAAACESGVIGSIPTVNARTPEVLEDQLKALTARLARPRADGRLPAPWSLNLVVHSTNKRLPADLALCVKYRAPVVITALGSPKAVVNDVHAYGGLVFADVNTPEYAYKAAQANVDGLVLVCSGAGGHTGQMAAPAFVSAVREFWSGIIIVAGAVTDGYALRAAQAMGADLAYMGTRFVATTESMAAERYKAMLVDSRLDDVLLTKAMTGLETNILRPSLIAAGLDPDNLPGRDGIAISKDINPDAPRRWKDIWSAGHSVSGVDAVMPAAALIERIKGEYLAARAAMRERLAAG